MFCEKCGNQLNQYDTFCNRCGNKVAGGAQSVPMYSTVHNGNGNESGNRNSFSGNTYDFSNLPPDSLYSNNINSSNNSSSKKSLIITICVCGAILIGLIIAVVLLVVGKNGGFSKSDINKSQNIAQYEEDDREEQRNDNIHKIENTTIENIIESGSDYTQFGVYVYNIKTQNEFCYNANKAFLASAMGQIVILDTLSRVASDKDIDIEDEYVRFNYLQNGKEAPNSKNQDGDMLSIKECVEDVAIYGDNNKSNLIVDYIASVYDEDSGFDAINRMLSANGYKTTEINRKTFINSAYVDYSVGPNITTAKEIGSIYHSLLYNSGFGSSSYMKNIFKSISAKGEAIGLKKFVPSYYDVYNVNALTSQCTNNVAYISNGETELIVAILSETQEDKTKIENNDTRESIQSEIIEHIIETQFED